MISLQNWSYRKGGPTWSVSRQVRGLEFTNPFFQPREGCSRPLRLKQPRNSRESDANSFDVAVGKVGNASAPTASFSLSLGFSLYGFKKPISTHNHCSNSLLWDSSIGFLLLVSLSNSFSNTRRHAKSVAARVYRSRMREKGSPWGINSRAGRQGGRQWRPESRRYPPGFYPGDRTGRSDPWS